MFYVKKVVSLAGTGSGMIIPEPTIRKGSGSTKRQSLKVEDFLVLIKELSGTDDIS
jgi:hypothetical protein